MAGVTIHYSGYSYIMMKIAYYIPFCTVVAWMNVLQIADCDEEEYNELLEVIEEEKRRQEAALIDDNEVSDIELKYGEADEDPPASGGL